VVVVPGNKTVRDFVLTALLVYISSEIENDAPSVIVMTFSLPLTDVVPDASAFNATVAAAVRAVSSVAVSGKTVRLTLSDAVVKSDAVTVAYTKPATKPLQTPDGLQVPSFTPKSVTNNVN
ncbi:MAG TPA: SwmB domain-containing protein, partial [Bacteroidales bacterium]|nr:SwmB domain-containing protein [Bacteroidales bacterium]